MYPFLESGLKELGGVSVAPTDLKSFCGEFINLVYSISSQFMGAVATPEFLMYFDYFIRKDYGENYLERLDEVVENNVKQRTLVKVIDNYFQQVVHSMNMPAGNRGYAVGNSRASHTSRACSAISASRTALRPNGRHCPGSRNIS